MTSNQNSGVPDELDLQSSWTSVAEGSDQTEDPTRSLLMDQNQ